MGYVQGGGNGETKPSSYYILVTQPYISYDTAICSAPLMGGNVQSPWCNRGIKFNNGCAVLKNCAGGGEPQAVSNGAFFADLKDCGGGNRGTCYAWHDVANSHSCSTQEAGRLSYSRVACKILNFNGVKA